MNCNQGKTKILFMVSTLAKCGPTNQLFYLISAFEHDEFDLEIITLSLEDKSSALDSFAELGIKIHLSPIRNHLNFFQSLKWVVTKISEIKPDIIHTQGLRSDIISGLFLKKYKRLSTLRAYPQVDYSMTYSYITSLFLIKLHTYALQNISCVIGVSKAVSENASQYLKLNNVYTIENSFPEIY